MYHFFRENVIRAYDEFREETQTFIFSYEENMLKTHIYTHLASVLYLIF